MTIAEKTPLEAPLEHEIDPALQKLIQKHPGKWVAITRQDLLAVGDTLSDVWERARAQGIEAPIVYRVPEEGTRTYFY